MAILVLLWVMLIIYKAHYCKVPQNVALDKDNSLALRGICAIEIVLGHLGIATESLFLYPNRKAGILFVGIFFMLSGYGLAHSVVTKEGYIKSFLWKRIPKIIAPAYAIYIIYILLLNGGGSGCTWQSIVNPISFFEMTNWYVWELLGLYVLFWFSVRYNVLRKNYVLIFIVSTIFVCVAFVSKIDSPWYGSTFCFWLGLFYYEKQDEIKRCMVNKRSWLNVIILGMLVGVSIVLFFILGENSIVGNLLARNIASVAFVLMVIIVLHYVRVGNVVSGWLGKYSYEIFLFHPMFINLLRDKIDDNLLFSIAVIGCSCLASLCYRNCANGIKNIGRKIWFLRLRE